MNEAIKEFALCKTLSEEEEQDITDWYKKQL